MPYLACTSDWGSGTRISCQLGIYIYILIRPLGDILKQHKILFYMIIASSGGWGPNQQADRAWGDYLHPAFVCSEFLNSLAGTVLVQS